MALPLTKQEAERMGLKKVPPDKLKKPKNGSIEFEPRTKDYMCYVGPCDGGFREVCYYSDTGCDDCFYSSDNCP